MKAQTVHVNHDECGTAMFCLIVFEAIAEITGRGKEPIKAGLDFEVNHSWRSPLVSDSSWLLESGRARMDSRILLRMVIRNKWLFLSDNFHELRARDAMLKLEARHQAVNIVFIESVQDGVEIFVDGLGEEDAPHEPVDLPVCIIERKRFIVRKEFRKRFFNAAIMMCRMSLSTPPHASTPKMAFFLSTGWIVLNPFRIGAQIHQPMQAEILVGPQRPVGAQSRDRAPAGLGAVDNASDPFRGRRCRRAQTLQPRWESHSPTCSGRFQISLSCSTCLSKYSPCVTPG